MAVRRGSLGSNQSLSGGTRRGSLRQSFQYNRFDPPPEIAEVNDLKDQEIPEGKVGIISSGAMIDDDGSKQFKDKRFVAVANNDINLPLKRARMVLRKMAMANTNTMMEREVIKEVIDEDRKRWVGCVTLPISITFFVFYLLAVVFHEAVTFTHITTSPIRNALQQGIDEVNTRDDVYTFLQETYLPFFYAQYDNLGSPLPRDRWSVVNTYSQLIGASTMDLQRSVAKPCQEMATFVECYPQDQLTGDAFGEDLAKLPAPVRSVPGAPWALVGNWIYAYGQPNTSSLLQCKDEGFTSTGCGSARRLLDLKYESTSTMPVASSGGPRYSFILDSTMPFAQLYNRVEYLKQRKWLDAQSTTLVVKSVVVNNQYSAPRLIYVNTYFYFSRGGGVFTDLLVEGKALTMWADQKSYVADFLFVVMLIVRTCGAAVQIFRAIVRRRCRADLCNATFLFTFVTLSLSWLNILFMVLQEMMTGPVRTSLDSYLADMTPAMSEDFYKQVSGVWLLARYARPLVAYANFFFLCQIFIALQWQPRLAVVTHTLLACGSDLFHYLIVLTLTIAAFALSGMVIFGRRIIEFSDPFAAIGICFKIAIETEYDWNSLSNKEWMTSFTWVILYLLLVVMLMLNMVLAIIMDVYAEVRMHSGDNMTIFQHLAYIYRRLWYRANWVSDEELMDQVCEMPQNITIVELRQAFPEMHHYQLEYLQEQCKNKAQRIQRVGMNKGFISQTTAAIQIGLEEISLGLDRLKARGWMGKGVESGSDESREWVRDIFASIAAQKHWMDLTAKHVSTLEMRMRRVTVEEHHAQLMSTKTQAGRSVKMRGSMVSPDA